MSDLLKFTKTLLTGGGATAVDGISATALVGGELCWACVSNVAHLYQLDPTSGASADGVNIIIPVVGTVGTKRWILQSKKVGSGTVTTDHIAESTSAHGVNIDGVLLKDGGATVLTGGTNTFNLTNGTASLDVAAGAAVNIDANLTVPGAVQTPAAIAAGDLWYGSATGVLSALAAGLDGKVLLCKGVAAPEWSYNIQEITELCSVD